MKRTRAPAPGRGACAPGFRYAPAMGQSLAVVIGGAAVPLLLSCLSPAGECGPGGACPAGQTCHPRYNFCYQPEAPQVSWASPLPDQILPGATATASGLIAFGGEYSAEISIGRPDLWRPLSVASAGQFSAQLPLPTSDGAPQPVRIRLTEPASLGGRVTVSSIYRAVDNVAPALSFSEPSPRPAPTTVRVRASEPLDGVLPAAVPLDGDAPAVAGRWNGDHTEVRFEGLAHDATYAVQVPAGSLRDRAGNPAGAFAMTFTTGPVTPPSGATIPIGTLDLTDLAVSSDGEGAVSLLLSSAQGIVVWGELSPRTGLFRMLGQATGIGLQDFQAISAPMPNQRWPDGTSRRALGAMMGRAASGAVVRSLVYQDVYSDAGRLAFGSVNPGGLSYLPGPGSCAQPPGPITLEQDPSTGQIVLRQGGRPPSPLSLPAAPSWSLFHAAESAEWVSLDAGTLFRTPRRCACDAGCELGTAQPVASGALAASRLSVGDTPGDDRAYAYDTASGRTLTCMRACGQGSCSNVGSEGDVAASELSVAGANEGSFLLDARRTGGAVVLYRRDLRRGCGGGPLPSEELGRLDTGSGIRKFRPAMFGSRPGLLYISTAGGPGVLRTFIP